MIVIPCSLLLFLVVAEQALTYSTWRYPRTVSSSSLVHPTFCQQLVSTSFSRTITPSPRSFTTFLSIRKPRSSSSAKHLSKAKFDALEKEIGAIKHLLKGGNSTTEAEDIREFIPIYEGCDKATLLSLLEKLQDKENELLKQNTALISKTAIESEGTLRWKKI